VKAETVTKAAVFCALVALATTVRIVSETPNFSAVAAASLFAGFYFRSAAAAFAIPLLTMTISDQVIGGYTRTVMVAVYASLLIPIAWRSVLRQGLSGPRVIWGSIISSVAFYLLTNLAVWVSWYPATYAGFARCYTVALPFFINTAMSDLLFSALFFGAYAAAVRCAPAQEIAPGYVAA
jgi:hypothetical protein